MPETSHEFLATGYVFTRNLYFVDGSFFLVEDESATEPTLNVENWIKERVAARSFGVSVVQGWGAVCNRSNQNQIRSNQNQTSKPLDSLRRIESAILITDFLPKYQPHLYHMLENMIGAWATLERFLGAEVQREAWPDFLVLPQNNQSEFGTATVVDPKP